MMTVDDLAELVRRRYRAATATVGHRGSGRIVLDVVFGERLFVLEYFPGEGFGVDEVTDDEVFLVGYREVFADAIGAGVFLLNLLDGVQVREATPEIAAQRQAV